MLAIYTLHSTMYYTKKIENNFMLLLKLKSFARWADSEELSDLAIKKAIDEIENGLIDAELGAGLFKQRVARDGQGKRGGFRTILAFRSLNRAIFILGFPKNKKDNIGEVELQKLKILSKKLLSSSDVEIQERITAGELIEVH